MSNADRDLEAFQKWIDSIPEELRGGILSLNEDLLFRIFTRIYRASIEQTSELVRTTFLLGWYMRDKQGDFMARLEEELGKDRGKAASTPSYTSPVLN